MPNRGHLLRIGGQIQFILCIGSINFKNYTSCIISCLVRESQDVIVGISVTPIQICLLYLGKDQDNIYEIFPVIQIHKNLVNIGKNQNVIIDIYVTSIQICLLRHTLVNLR
ncbi:uncharacterized protein LOC143452346 isoform X3 [Clavelina lepadiformis]|uniref:uncharacterized protein LOC143452346 isoform X3 n=1 Tax=Clavelina lepadiformis TaxID=159417 RepID=UPI004042BB08